MKRTLWTRVWLAAVVVAAYGGIAAGADEKAPRPNIVLCMTDDQGWGDVSYNGLKQIQTPASTAWRPKGCASTASMRRHRCVRPRGPA